MDDETDDGFDEMLYEAEAEAAGEPFDDGAGAAEAEAAEGAEGAEDAGEAEDAEKPGDAEAAGETGPDEEAGGAEAAGKAEADGDAKAEADDDGGAHLYRIDGGGHVDVALDDQGRLAIHVPEGTTASLGGDFSDGAPESVVVTGGGTLEIEPGIVIPCSLFVGGSGDHEPLEGDTTLCRTGGPRPVVHAVGDARVEASGDANVMAFGDSRVDARGNAWVRADDRAAVALHDTAIGDMQGHAVSVGHDDSAARLDGDAVDLAMDRSTADAGGRATVLCEQLAKAVYDEMRDFLAEHGLEPDEAPQGGAPRANASTSASARALPSEPPSPQTDGGGRVRNARGRIRAMIDRTARLGGFGAMAGLHMVASVMAKTGERLSSAARRPLRAADRIALKLVPDLGPDERAPQL